MSDAEDTINFLGNKSVTLSFRLKMSEVGKLLDGEPFVVVIRGKRFKVELEE